ncbi:PTS sugar transporter subunit IIC [Clostridium sp.]|uniref:PTS sugar transporter subunit IIC n=1 Tax=Clostridium sp. TaxID=1506 RepID=UPI003F390817
MEKENFLLKDYVNKVLAGTATGIVVGLIPNAILGSFLKGHLGTSILIDNLYYAACILQYLVPVIIGVLVALQFKLDAMRAVVVGATVFLASGAYAVVDGSVKMVGIGDLINIMLVSGLAVFIIRLIGNKLGSLTLLLLPIIVGVGVGTIGMFMLPYTKSITSFIGTILNNFVTLQPLLMCILISIAFAILIISPISTVAVGVAIGLTGLGAGAAAVGVTACTAVLVFGSIKANNKSGVTLSVLLGAMKMLMPNFLANPIMMIPIVLNGIITGIGAYALNILGTPDSAGFGIVGLTGPLAAINASGSAVPAIIAFFIIPFVGAIILDVIFRKILNVYNENIFCFAS